MRGGGAGGGAGRKEGGEIPHNSEVIGMLVKLIIFILRDCNHFGQHKEACILLIAIRFKRNKF